MTLPNRSRLTSIRKSLLVQVGQENKLLLAVALVVKEGSMVFVEKPEYDGRCKNGLHCGALSFKLEHVNPWI